MKPQEMGKKIYSGVIGGLLSASILLLITISLQIGKNILNLDNNCFSSITVDLISSIILIFVAVYMVWKYEKNYYGNKAPIIEFFLKKFVSIIRKLSAFVLIGLIIFLIILISFIKIFPIFI